MFCSAVPQVAAGNRSSHTYKGARRGPVLEHCYIVEQAAPMVSQAINVFKLVKWCRFLRQICVEATLKLPLHVFALHIKMRGIEMRAHYCLQICWRVQLHSKGFLIGGIVAYLDNICEVSALVLCTGKCHIYKEKACTAFIIHQERWHIAYLHTRIVIAIQLANGFQVTLFLSLRGLSLYFFISTCSGW